MEWLLSVLLFLTGSMAFASAATDKQIDAIQNSTGGSLISVPSGGTSFATTTGTQTFGASSTWNGATIGVAYGGTGDVTLTLNGILFGNGTSAAGITAAGTQYQVLQAGVSGVPTFGALNLSQSAAITGTMPVANGGTGQSSLTAHYVLLGNGTSGITQETPSTSGYVLTSNGASADPTFQPVGSSAPALNGGSASPESVTASGGVTLTGLSYNNYVWVVGSPGAVTVTATPNVTACTLDGQHLTIEGTDATKTVTLQPVANLSGSGLQINGPVTLGLYSTILLHCNATAGVWVEDARSN